MKAITIQQPWAWAVIHGGKSVENRTRIGTWLPAIGQTILVHAGKRWSQRGAEFELLQHAYASWLGFTHWGGPFGGHTALPIDPRTEDRDRELIDFGAIIGSVEVENVHPDAGCCHPWGESTYDDADGTQRIDIVHLVLANPQPIRPYPITGRLGLWTVDDETVKDMAS